jgi:hypothetical protein
MDEGPFGTDVGREVLGPRRRTFLCSHYIQMNITGVQLLVHSQACSTAGNRARLLC